MSDEEETCPGPGTGLKKYDSTKSDASISSLASEDLDHIMMKESFQEAPRDLFHEVDGDNVRVVREGDTVPCVTKYKKYNGGTAVVKFRFN